MFKIFFSGLILFHNSAAYLVPDAHGHHPRIEFKAPPAGCGSFTSDADGKCVLPIQKEQVLSFNVTGDPPKPGMFFARLVPNLKHLVGGATFKANGAARVELRGGTLDPYGFATVCSYTTPGSTSPQLVDSVGTVLWTLPASVVKLTLTVTRGGVPQDYEVPTGVTHIWIDNSADPKSTPPSQNHFDHYLKMTTLTGTFSRACHDPLAPFRAEEKGLGLQLTLIPFIRLDPVTCPPAVFP